VQLLVDNRSDSTKMHGATIRFIGPVELKIMKPPQLDDGNKCCRKDHAVV